MIRLSIFLTGFLAFSFSALAVNNGLPSLIKQDSELLFESAAGALYMNQAASGLSKQAGESAQVDIEIITYAFRNSQGAELGIGYTRNFSPAYEPEFKPGSGRTQSGQLLDSDGTIALSLLFPGSGYVELIRSFTDDSIENGYAIRTNLQRNLPADTDQSDVLLGDIGSALSQAQMSLLIDFQYTINEHVMELASTGDAPQTWLDATHQNRTFLGCVAATLGLVGTAALTLEEAALCGTCVAVRLPNACVTCAGALAVNVAILINAFEQCQGAGNGGSGGSGTGGTGGSGGSTGGGSTGGGGGSIPGGGTVCGTACSGNECGTTCWAF